MKKLAIVLVAILAINKRKTSATPDQSCTDVNKKQGRYTLSTLDSTTNNKKYQGGIYVQFTKEKRNKSKWKTY